MTSRSAHLGAVERLLAALAAIPPGRVAGHAALAAHLGLATPVVVRLLAAIGSEGSAAPWHRVVADGGAVGRHRRREEQIALLRGEGVTVSPAGVVQDFARIAVTCLEAGACGPRGDAVSPDSGSTPSRARGRHARPTSTAGGR